MRPPTARVHRKRLWRFVWLAAGYFLILAGIRLWWGRLAEDRLQSQIETYRAAGQPVTIEDFQALTPDIPDDQNAAKDLLAAANQTTPWKHQTPDISQVYGDPALRNEYRADIIAYLEANQPALDLIRAARDKPDVDWGIRYSKPLMALVAPHYSGQRQLTKLLVLSAQHNFDQGQHAAALQDLRDALMIGDRVGERPPLFIGTLVETAIHGLVFAKLQDLTPDLCVQQPANHAGDSPTCPTRSEVERLITTLLDEQGFRRSWQYALYAERLSILDAGLMVADNPANALRWMGTGPGTPAPPAIPGNSPLSWTISAIRPMWILDTKHAVMHLSAYAESTRATDYQHAHTLFPPNPPQYESSTEKTVHLMTSVLLPSVSGSVRIQFRALTERRMAATALALRLYKLDHGQRPATLDELVPEYLPQVPRDAFAANNQPLRYLPNADPPRLYSVGRDGVDQSGQYVTDEYGNIERDSSDQPWFLEGTPAPDSYPTTSPSTQAHINQPQPEQTDGKQGEEPKYEQPQ